MPHFVKSSPANVENQYLLRRVSVRHASQVSLEGIYVQIVLIEVAVVREQWSPDTPALIIPWPDQNTTSIPGSLRNLLSASSTTS